MFKKFFVSLLLFSLFIPCVLSFASENEKEVVIDNPNEFLDSLIVSSLSDFVTNVPYPQEFINFKSQYSSWIEYICIDEKSDKVFHYINELDSYSDLKLVNYSENGRDFTGIARSNGYSLSSRGIYFYHKLDGTNISSIYSGNITNGSRIVFHGNQFGYDWQLVNYNNLRFSNSDTPIDDYLPIPPSIDVAGNYGYEFIYPLNKDNINLHSTSNSDYYKVPFKVKVKNFYTTLSVKKLEEKIKDNFSINNYKTEVTSLIWISKPDLIGINENNIFTVEGYYYIPISFLPKSETLKANIYEPVSTNWIDGSISVTYSSDGSIPSYNPNDSVDNGNNLGSTDSIPSAPVDGSVSDWFKYFGDLLIWFVTYPFKLLNEVFTTLIGYINNMFSILTPVTQQLNNVLSFIPSDILNVCWGFLSFTLLYSVITGVLKMIRR